MSNIARIMQQAAAGAAGGELLAIEDVFSTYLYTGNGSTQSISNGINLNTTDTTIGYTSLLQNFDLSGNREYIPGKIIEDSSGNFYAIIKFRNQDTGVDQSTVTKYNSSSQQVWSYRVQDTQNPRYASIIDIVFNSAGNLVVYWTPASVNNQLYINVIDKDTGAILATSDNSNTSTAMWNALSYGGNLYWAGRQDENTVFINSDTAPGTEIQARRVQVSSYAQKYMLIPQSDGQPVLVSAISDQNSGTSTNGWVFTKLASNLQSEIWSTRWSHSNGSSTQFNSRFMAGGVQYYDSVDNMLYIFWRGTNSISGNTSHTNYISKFNIATGAHVLSRSVYFNAQSTSNIDGLSITKFGNKIICAGSGNDGTTRNVLLEFDTNLNSLNARTVTFSDFRNRVRIYAGNTSVYYHLDVYNSNSEIRKFPEFSIGEPINGVSTVSGLVTVTSTSLTNTTTGYVPINVTFNTASDLMGSSGSSLQTNSTTLTYSRSTVPAITEPGPGGLVWIKSRSAATDNFLFDTTRGATKEINSNSTAAEATLANSLTAFNLSGFSIGSATGIGVNAATYASWTFRKAERFFDVVTYTGNGATSQNIAHNLGVRPGFIVIKPYSSTGDWSAIARANSTQYYSNLKLNTTGVGAFGTWSEAGTYPISDAVFTTYIGPTPGLTNTNGVQYVAYLFAHDPLGPSGDGSDGLIACGSYVGTGLAGNFQNLGWEPQYVLVKGASTAGYNWNIHDVMRGMSESQSYTLKAESSEAENLDTPGRLLPRPTGFEFSSSGLAANNASGVTYIYIAIRRGPMREPTVGTEVLGLSARTGTGANATVTGGQTADAVLVKNRGSAVASLFSSRMTGTGYLVTSTTAAEVAAGTTILQANPWDVMDGVKVGTTSTITNASSNTFINYLFRRAPGFFDVVAYTGDGASTQDIAHNLGVAPEFIFLKSRSLSSVQWPSWHSGTPNHSRYLNSTLGGFQTAGGLPYYVGQTVSNTTFRVSSDGSATQSNGSGSTYIAYLFATLPGISKVGSYTGNGSSQTINCGFTGGARFVLIKRTDSTGDWYVWDTARGIVAGNDPHLSLNTTAAEVTSNDTIDPDSSGFIVNQVAATNINVSSASYIFMAIS